MTKKKILGTNKFTIYVYNGKNVRGKFKGEPQHFVYRQWGRITIYDENGKVIKDRGFTNYGQMINIINEIMIKSVRNNLKVVGTWKKGNGRITK